MQAHDKFKISSVESQSIQERVETLMSQMGLDEKIGQMSQLQGGGGRISDHLAWSLRESRVGSILNEADLDVINEMQRIAVEESRLGIPLLIARDVIHGFKTVFPIPLGLAATWDEEAVKSCAQVSAQEAASTGINWTFAPMIDVTRDPRWGRIAESFGEDPYLCGLLGAAMVKGYQGQTLSDTSSIAACAKHFAGYGASEGGRDYNTVSVPENELRNVHLRPFKMAADAGVASFMSAFCDLNGVPATGNTWLLNDVLRQEWKYKGVVVSDWESIVEMTVHGYTHDDTEAAYRSVKANVDIEMASSSYIHHLQELIEHDKISIDHIDKMVERILRLKFELGLFENPYTNAEDHTGFLTQSHKQAAKEAAIKSCVLLKNEQVLPLAEDSLKSIAVIGPLADDPYEQMGTWVFDGEMEASVTCLQGLKQRLGKAVEIHHVPALKTTRAATDDEFQAAISAADKSDLSIVVVGEESFMSGEAHSRAEIDLPGQQAELIKAVATLGKPVVVVVMAGRPLTLEPVLEDCDALLYAWHPGTMGGAGIAELLLGDRSPSGKLPVTFPKKVGQVPIYYSQKNTGRPANDETCVDMQTVAPRAPQTSLGMTSFHLDAGHRPLFPFGYGLSYGSFQYVKLTMSHHSISMGQNIDIYADVINVGAHAGDEIVQLYVRDLVGSVTRPVKELKGFQRVSLRPGERERVCFTLHTDDLAFYNDQMQLVTEAGQFHVWVGGSSEASLWAEFEVTEAEHQ